MKTRFKKTRLKYTVAPLLLLGTLMLGGCDPQDLSPATRDALCTVLVGPIRYNTYNPKSGRYSGPVLALDLKQRNQIGQRLGCPLYRRTWSAPVIYGRKW